jgi:fructan beta-fructosidase
VGNFDGKTFVPDPEFADTVAHWLDYGRDNYAGVTWSDVPAADGRRLFIGWMSNWSYATVVPTTRWRSAMTLPRTLHLLLTDTGMQLASRPVEELTSLRLGSYTLPPVLLSGEDALPVSGPLQEVDLTWEMGDTLPEVFGLRLFNDQGEEVRIGYRTRAHQYFIDRRKSGTFLFSDQFAGLHVGPARMSGKVRRMHILADVASAELFADEGLTTLTDIYFPGTPFTHAAVFCEGGRVQVAVKGWNLRPVRP